MKTITIAIKDTLITFRDRNAILLMIAAPLLISAVMGLAFGGQGQGASPISAIPLIVVNADEGELGQRFAEVMASIDVDTKEGVRPLFSVTGMDDKDAAIEQIELGESRGAVFIPAGFSDGLTASFDEGENAARETVVVKVFTDPTASVSPGIIRGVVSRVAGGFSTAVIGNIVAVEQLLDHVTEIPVLYVNDDTGPVSAGIDAAFSPENFEGLFVLSTLGDFAAAQDRLAAGEAEALIHVLPGFSESVTSGEDVSDRVIVLGAEGSLAAPIVKDVVASVVAGFGTGGGGGQTAGSPVLANLEDLEGILKSENDSFGQSTAGVDRITVDTRLVGESEDVNLLNYFVPSMSIFFLMFAVFHGTRSILEEERDGTLHRMMTTPTGRVAIILGKIGGAFLSGILQFAVLVLVSALIFGVDWGSAPFAMMLVVIATVAAATSLGAFVASFARNNNQANVLGTAITLIFAILGGNFIDYRALPDWLTSFSRLTINRWAMEGFVNLTIGGQGLAGVALNVGVLFGMAALFFGLAVFLFDRRFVK